MSSPVAMPDGSSHGNGEPSHWVRHWAHLVAAGGAVLDVASGAGRHARFFASLGHPVTALDRDAAALDLMRDEPLVTTLVADIEGAAWPLPVDARFAAIVVTNYLHRPLFPQLLRSLAPGGVLVYETFAQGNESVGKPSNPAFLLAPGELLDVVRGHLRVVAFQDGFLAQPRPAYVQRICAIMEADRSAERAEVAPPPCYELAG
ncbi:class I SAM-dependent methyltransferase [Paraburkholderia domus]|nr:class I SAM-dependent methyltransferase [Paraburkholderia domus]MBK5048682.1 class I SAM-dependent methyltransferase [Burkholderia sp. R-70006]MBK5085742.1 class I SAM-dependent methyltransferase [Burkholderia sp. R-69927]MBK5165928.1 class I SAM-dependent methyltransferase [Burkholderia sp. R-70211]MBK5180485.1 class I SAM-dependent methyltransferase [Burkholderia sp. R-69749]MCI0146092.1 methyltransferase domain-containing protein [Paraburkholderia sediminicola]